MFHVINHPQTFKYIFRGFAKNSGPAHHISLSSLATKSSGVIIDLYDPRPPLKPFTQDWWKSLPTLLKQQWMRFAFWSMFTRSAKNFDKGLFLRQAPEIFRDATRAIVKPQNIVLSNIFTPAFQEIFENRFYTPNNIPSNQAYQMSYLLEKPKIVQYRIAQTQFDKEVIEFAQITVKLHIAQTPVIYNRSRGEEKTPTNIQNIEEYPLLGTIVPDEKPKEFEWNKATMEREIDQGKTIEKQTISYYYNKKTWESLWKSPTITNFDKSTLNYVIFEQPCNIPNSKWRVASIV